MRGSYDVKIRRVLCVRVVIALCFRNCNHVRISHAFSVSLRRYTRDP